MTKGAEQGCEAILQQQFLADNVASSERCGEGFSQSLAETRESLDLEDCLEMVGDLIAKAKVSAYYTERILSSAGPPNGFGPRSGLFRISAISFSPRAFPQQSLTVYFHF